MTFNKRVNVSLWLLYAYRKIKFQFKKSFPDNRNALKIISSFPLVVFIFLLSISSLQACQQIVAPTETIAMNQDNDPKLPAGVELIRDSSDGTVRVLKGDGLSTPLMTDEDYSRAVAGGTPGEISIAFINAYRRLFRIDDPTREMIVSAIKTDNLGMTHVKLKQQYKGIEVWPADINVHLNKSGDVYLVQGRYTQTPSAINQKASLVESEALDVISRDIKVEKDKWRKWRTQLIVYCGLPKSPQLGYRIYVEIRVDNAWNYIVDAQTGSILEKTSAIQNKGGGCNPSAGKIIMK